MDKMTQLRLIDLPSELLTVVLAWLRDVPSWAAATSTASALHAATHHDMVYAGLVKGLATASIQRVHLGSTWDGGSDAVTVDDWPGDACDALRE